MVFSPDFVDTIRSVLFLVPFISIWKLSSVNHTCNHKLRRKQNHSMCFQLGNEFVCFEAAGVHCASNMVLGQRYCLKGVKKKHYLNEDDFCGQGVLSCRTWRCWIIYHIAHCKWTVIMCISNIHALCKYSWVNDHHMHVLRPHSSTGKP